MLHNPFITRFAVGKTYRLHTSPNSNLLGGTITILAELSPRDKWGNRTLLVDAYLSPKDRTCALEHHLGTRCFVEEGYTEFRDSFGTHTIPVEIATLQGIYPDRAKAYANAEMDRGCLTHQPSTIRKAV